MAKLPQPHSFQQFVGDMLNKFFSRTGITGLPVNDPLLTVFELAAQGDTKAEQSLFQMLTSVSLDNASGDGLLKIAADEKVTVQQNAPAYGSGQFIDTSFTKISSTVYPGLPAVLAGSTTVNVTNGSFFTGTGKLYIGRNTVNQEGPLTYTNVVNNGNYWTFTLSTPTTKFHNVLEQVTLAQGGNRVVATGQLVQTGSTGLVQPLSYRTLDVATLPDGETFSNSVPVVCTQPGSVGNVIANSINIISTAPFSGASFNNPLPIGNGVDAWNDEQIRQAIRLARQSRTQGTDTAILNGVRGLINADENKRITSASLVAKNGQPTTLYIDDGTGYEEVRQGVGTETLVDAAVGGEQYFTLGQPKPIAKAFVKTSTQQPWFLQNGAPLTVTVGGFTFVHSFSSSEFANTQAATAYECVTSINADVSLPYVAQLSDDATTFSLLAKTETQEDIQVVTTSASNDANLVLGFPVDKAYTLKLYKNNVLLYKDGQQARLRTAPQGAWSGTIGAATETLGLQVDGRQTVTYSFSAADFVNAGTGYSTMSAANSLQSWAQVFNYKIVGVTAIVEVDHIVLISNLGYNSNAKVTVFESSSSLFAKGMFSLSYGTVTGTAPKRSISGSGLNNDYSLNRNTGNLALTVPLSTGDSLSAGSAFTRASVTSGTLSNPTISTTGSMWVFVDGTATPLSTAIISSTTFASSIPSTGLVRYTLNSTNLINSFVDQGDWVILWDTNLVAQGMPANAYLVTNVGVSGTDFFEIEAPASSLTSPGTTALANPLGVSFVRATVPPQNVLLTATITGLDAIVTSINAGAKGFVASVTQSNQLTLTTDTFGATGSIMVGSVSTGLLGLSLPIRKFAANQVSHLGNVVSGNSDIGTHDLVSNVEVYDVVPGLNPVLFLDDPMTWAGGQITWTGTNNSATNFLGTNKGHAQSISVVGQLAYSISQLSYDHTTGLVTVTVGSTTGLAATQWVYFKFDKHAILKDGFYYIQTLIGGTTFTINAELGGTNIIQVTSGKAFLSIATTRTDQAIVPTVANTSYNSTRPYSISPTDNLSVTIDQNEVAQNYLLSMYRRVQPGVGQTYVQNNVVLRDLDNSLGSLYNAWGAFDFSDFAVYAKAKTVSDPGSATKAVKWSATRFGPEGNGLRMRYTYGTAANSPVGASTTSSEFFYNNVTLATGADKGKYGLSASSAASSYHNGFPSLATVVFGFDLPAGAITSSGAGSYFALNFASQLPVGTITDLTHTLKAGGSLYVYSATPDAGLPNGVYTVDSFGGSVARTTQLSTGAYTSTVSYAVALCTAGAATPIQVNFLGGTALAIGDIVNLGIFPYINGTHSISAVTKWSFTMITDVENTYPYIQDVMVPLLSTSNIAFYPLNAGANTTGAIVTAVNALTNSPLTGFLVGDGTGTVTQSSEDQYYNATVTLPFYELAGGVNYVSSSNITAGTSTVSFKIDPSVQEPQISGSNSFNFANEELRLVPITAPTFVRYLQSSAVGGLFSNAQSQTALNGHSLQENTFTIGSAGSVQTTGGSANAAQAAIFGTGTSAQGWWNGYVTVKTNATTGFLGGSWCKIQNSATPPKNVFSTTDTLASSTNVLTVVKSGGLGTVSLVLGSGNWTVRKEGRFVCFHIVGGFFDWLTAFGGTDGGGYVMVRNSFSSANQGPFRVVRSSMTGFWIENTLAVEEQVASISAGCMQFMSSTSIVPGDQFHLQNNLLGAANNGTWTVVDIPAVVGTYSSVTLSKTLGAVSAVACGPQAASTYFTLASPDVFYKQIKNIQLNPADPAYSDILFYDESNYGSISNANGSVVSVLDKLSFPVALAIGQDGYSVDTGLIHTANQTVYGDPAAPDAFPAIAASSANINIQGPTVKRTQVSLVIRVRSGTLSDISITNEIINRVRSAAASVINNSAVGQPIPLSQIVAAAEMVSGVTSVAILSPTYNAGNDLISVQPYEKALVINLTQDVSVNVVGE